MTNEYLAKAAKLAPIVERVHGQNHPELTRVRELTEQLQDTQADTSAVFAQLRDVTHDYTVPGDACEAYQWTYQALERADKAHRAA